MRARRFSLTSDLLASIRCTVQATSLELLCPGCDALNERRVAIGVAVSPEYGTCGAAFPNPTIRQLRHPEFHARDP